MSSIAANVERVRDRICTAAVRAGRDPDAVHLVAVSKTVGVEQIAEAVAVGVRDFGENYVQDAVAKKPHLGPDVRWHFIGHLQTNKARQVAGSFALIHSLDSVRLAVELGRRAASAGITQDVLIEVRLDPDGAKTGIEPSHLPELADAVAGIGSVRLLGLMGMAPIVPDPELARPHFAALRGMLDLLPASARQVLSMGMTGDFEAAILEGATHVRVGTAVFGPRA
ncbi:MAG: YggS family pyridoxal phosphate-dependent enzyme [Armatimonadetes bacterium]|nr:YggS family pyridoxal phosphate-dependent enzyme [Armatimonadota bacterium]